MANQIKVLNFSTHHEDCGIGKYQEMFLEALSQNNEVESHFFDASPNQTKLMNEAELSKVLARLRKQLKDYDILHIQHEFSFFSRDELVRICKIAKELHKKLVITVHTSPNVAFQKTRLGGFGPHSVVHYLRALKHERIFHENFTSAVKLADLVLVHNKVTRKALIDLGVSNEAIGDIIIPVPQIDRSLQSDVIHQNLHVKKDDVVYGTVGFLHRFKGIKECIKALDFLPSNYKLAIIGGMHPFTDSEEFYNEVTDLIRDLKLIDRVYITGYIEKDEELNAAIRECDICVYAYDKSYYSNVSSAALTNAFANHVPVLGYPTMSFREVNEVMPAMQLTQSFSYYELARSLKKIDLEALAKQSKEYANTVSYPLMGQKLVTIYKQVLSI